MFKLRKLALVAVVWLTSAMTVAAGIPQIVCRCPKGKAEKPVRSSNTRTCGCNCGGRCCAGKKASCCAVEESVAVSSETANDQGSLATATSSDDRSITFCAATGRCLRAFAEN